MKANLEKEPFQIRGVELISENDTEKLMLERLWNEHHGPAEFARNPNGSVTLVITPGPGLFYSLLEKALKELKIHTTPRDLSMLELEQKIEQALGIK